MKKVLYTISSLIIIVTLGFFGLTKTSHTELKAPEHNHHFNKISAKVTSVNFENVSSRQLFTYNESAVTDNLSSIVSNVTPLTISKNNLKELVNLNSNALSLSIPKNRNENIELELIKAEILVPEFVVKERNGS